jgi:hypothetical protein
MHAGPASKNLLAARRQNGLERLDSVVGGLEKEIFHDGLGALELRDQHLGMRTARHFAADLRHDPIAASAVQSHEDAPLSRLHEIRGLGHLMLRDPCRSRPFPFCHSFGPSPGKTI